jgi:hypothetical protein
MQMVAPISTLSVKDYRPASRLLATSLAGSSPSPNSQCTSRGRTDAAALTANCVTIGPTSTSALALPDKFPKSQQSAQSERECHTFAARTNIDFYCSFFTSGHFDSDSGWNATSAGIVATSL